MYNSPMTDASTMSTSIDWPQLCMNISVLFSAIITMMLIYFSGRRDERVQSIRKITELRHTCYKQQETINILTTERDMYRSGYDAMSKRVQRIEYHSPGVSKRATVNEDRSRGEVA
jgi:hypothetical protein